MTDKLTKQVDNFFEYEKNDSLVEFKLNYQNFVCGNRLHINKRLLKLYKSYLDDSMNLYNEEDDPRFKIQSKEMTKKLKKIISYLENEQKILLLKKNYSDKKIKKKNKKKTKSNIVMESLSPALEDLSLYSFSKSFNIFVQSLKVKEIDDNLVKQATYIKNYLLDHNLDQEALSNVNYVNSVINNRIRQLDKDDNRRQILKSILSDFKYISNISIEEVKDDNLFYIIDYFIDKEDYYLYFKELTKYIPKIINVRYNEKHILIYILDKFIENYKMMLLDKKSNYVNKDYLKSIYLLFLKHSKLSISKSELKELDKMLIEFMNFVNKNITSSKRKNVVKLDLKDMYTDKMYNPKNRELLNDIDHYKLNSQINLIEENINRLFNVIDLTHEDTIMLNSPYAVFSIDNNKLKIHVLDLYNVIINYTELNKYMYNLMAKDEDDKDILSMLHMEEGKIYPTITYEIDEKINIYKSKILVKTSNDVKLKPYLDMTNTDNIEEATSKLEKLLNHSVMNYFEENNLPFVYSGRIKNDLEKQKILNDLTHILSKLEKEDFYKIYNALYNYHDKFHFEMVPFNGRYQLNVLNPTNYVGMTLQRIIHDVILETRNSDIEKERVIKKYEEELKTLVATINYYNDYVDKEVLKANKGKMKKRQKMFF